MIITINGQEIKIETQQNIVENPQWKILSKEKPKDGQQVIIYNPREDKFIDVICHIKADFLYFFVDKALIKHFNYEYWFPKPTIPEDE